MIAENVFFLAIEMVLVFLFVPRPYRALSVVTVLGLAFLFDYTLGGDIVTFTVPFMLIVAYKWSDIGKGGRLDGRDKLRAVCLGLAASSASSRGSSLRSSRLACCAYAPENWAGAEAARSSDGSCSSRPAPHC